MSYISKLFTKAPRMLQPNFLNIALNFLKFESLVSPLQSVFKTEHLCSEIQ